MSRSKSILRPSASEPCLVLLGKDKAQYARRTSKFGNGTGSDSPRTAASLSAKKGRKAWANAQTWLVVCVLLVSFAASYFRDNGSLAKELDDSACPEPENVRNASYVLPHVDFERFEGEWSKIGWLREPATAKMRCAFKTTRGRGREASEDHEFLSVPSAKTRGKGNFHFLLNGKHKLWVLDTDYEQWALFYTCSPHFDAISQQAFIVSRGAGTTLDLTTVGLLLNKLAEFNLARDFTIKEQAHQCAGGQP